MEDYSEGQKKKVLLAASLATVSYTHLIRSLQLVIVPMVFTSITLAIGQISDTRALGRISFKTIGGFLVCSAMALVLACGAGYMIYSAGLFNIQVDGLEGQAGSTGANPLNVVLSVVPSNVAATFSSNTSVLAIVFLAVTLGLCMNALGEERTSVLKKLITEINDIVAVSYTHLEVYKRQELPGFLEQEEVILELS